MPTAMHPAQFRKLWTASALSNAADGLALFAGPLLAAMLTRDPALVAGLAFVQRLPWLLFSLLGGALVDRLDRRRVMAALQVARALLVGGLGVAAALDGLSLPLLYAVFFLIGTAETVFDPASVTMLPAVVTRSELTRANARLAGTMTVLNQFIGQPLSGLLFGLAVAAPFIAGGFLYAGAAAAVLMLRGSFRSGAAVASGARRGPGRLRTEITEGVRWLLAHRFLRTLAVTLAVMNLAEAGTMAVLVLVAYDRLGLTPFQYGLFNVAYAAGGVIASLLAHRVIRRVGPGTVLRWGILIEAATWVVFATTRDPLVAGAVLALFGAYAIAWRTVTVTIRQTVVPAALLGRVTSAYFFITAGSAAIGALLGGLLARGIDLTAPFWVAAVLDVAVLAWAWRVLGKVPETAADEAPASDSPARR